MRIRGSPDLDKVYDAVFLGHPVLEFRELTVLRMFNMTDNGTMM